MTVPTIIPITQWARALPLATDVTVYTDTTNTSQAATGTTGSYLRADEWTYYFGLTGLSTIAPVIVATTTPLSVIYNNGVLGVGATLTSTLPGLLSIDSVAAYVGMRVLVWQQAAAAQNGIYSVTTLGTSLTPWVLTRTGDYDTPAQVKINQVVVVQLGSTNGNKVFEQIGTGPWTIGTTAINFQLFNLFSSITTIVTTWTNITGSSFTLVPNVSYIANNGGGGTTFTLPGAAAVGTQIQIQQGLSTSWTIAQNALQSISVDGLSTTVGVGGSLTSTGTGDAISFVCTVANTLWKTFGVVGNITIV